MNTFLIALGAVAVLLLEAVPGYVFVKRGMLGEDGAKSFSKVLLYLCQPCLVVYTFSNATFSLEKLGDIGLFALATLIINAVMLIGAVLILKRKFADTAYRVLTLAMAFANCAFFGIPIIEALLPEVAEGLMIYTTVYATVMNLLGWAVGMAIITGDIKRISPKRMFLNPAMLGLVIAVPIFVFSLDLPSALSDAVAILGRMTTPVSMLIMGMRLATTSLKSVFTSVRAYVAVLVKGFVMPLVAFGIALIIPMPTEVKQAFFIITACPTASVVLNFSEICNAGEREAAASVLLSTLFSVATLPTMMLLLSLLK